MDLAFMGEKIKTARMTKKYTLEKLSEKIGISRNFLWEIEAGRKAPAIQTLYSISKELDLSTDYMFGLNTSKQWLNSTGNHNKTEVNNLLSDLSETELSLIAELLKTYIDNKKMV